MSNEKRAANERSSAALAQHQEAGSWPPYRGPASDNGRSRRVINVQPSDGSSQGGVFGRKLYSKFNAIEIDVASPVEQKAALQDLLGAMLDEIHADDRDPDKWEARLIYKAMVHLKAGFNFAAYDAIATILVPLGTRGREGRSQEEGEVPKTLGDLRSHLAALIDSTAKSREAHAERVGNDGG